MNAVCEYGKYYIPIHFGSQPKPSINGFFFLFFTFYLAKIAIGYYSFMPHIDIGTRALIYKTIRMNGSTYVHCTIYHVCMCP